ncbi:glycerophosphoryl diester phosphodiesterase membrane domain-containing protein [Companilactobacillus jidongensis]|uniref:glycerophosphoryl diester phosphodiesterase membrane domain-containing protein n=1 Tax=Companilactobacillus jidongensis TaxID=2486006 RepID=UPI0013DDA911|nr:glycerophosphodiester phosphodiesterase [Companilactobacillus jidongensis]
MGSFRLFRDQNRNFWQYFWKYSQVIILIQLLITFIIVPLLNVLTNGVLYFGGIKYVSYTNFISIVTKRPLVFLGLVAILLLILLLVFSQFAFVLISFQAIKSKANLRWRDYLKTIFREIASLPFKAFGFFLLYFLIITPFASIGFSSNLLSKVKVPEFILEWLFQEHLIWGITLIIVYAVIFYVGIRWLFVLPLMIFDNRTVKNAIRQSWRMTRNKVVYYLLTFINLFIVITIATYIIFGIILAGQWGFDHITTVSFPTAIINLTLVQFINIISSIYATAISALIVLHQTRTQYIYNAHRSRSHRWFWIGLAVVTIISFMSYDTMYFKGWLMERPATISHRGVDNGNGVQNSIPALKTTSKEKPSYIEMDIQETKDHKYVVYHDNTLKGLAGINKRPSQMTLAELQRVTIHENGKTAHIASFDDYLKTSTKLHQKLLVEFKSVSGNSNDFVKNFAKKYGAQLERNGDMVHSLKYSYIEDSTRYMPKVAANYILSFNLTGVPISDADGFTMEYTTLNSNFVDNAHAIHKKVYAWTVNDTAAMSQMMFLDVDGIITDNLSDLKTEIRTNFDQAGYAKRIWNFILQMQSPF